MSRTQAHASVFFAIADPTRRAILDALLKSDQTVGELLKAFSKVSQSAFSQHLAVLRKAGLVIAQRSGTFQRYRLNPEPLAEVVDWASHYSKFWDNKLDALDSYLEKTQ
jgi:DNA-binding transcriptional ArsR family regulator